MAERRSKRTMVNWSALRTNLVRVVGDFLLATNDIDSYVDMRAVCHNWRTAIPKPTALGAGDDCRFRPRQWVMLDEKDEPEDEEEDGTEDEPEDGVNGRLFLHRSTGRFLRRRLPLFGYDKYILVGASDGLLVLGSSKGLHAALLVNPFTRDMLPFAAPIPREPRVLTSVAGSSPTLIFTFEDWCKHRADMVYCADATSKLCEVQFQGWEGEDFCLKSLVSYAGHVYVLDYNGGILKIVGAAPNYHGELMQMTYNDGPDQYLVESAGELLLVNHGALRRTENILEVYRVDTDRNVLEPVTSIGSRALFLGARSLSVDAGKMKSVDCNCVYYVECGDPYFIRNIKRYDLSNSNVESISCVVPGTEIQIRPCSIAQALLEYCLCLPKIGEQIERLRRYY